MALIEGLMHCLVEEIGSIALARNCRVKTDIIVSAIQRILKSQIMNIKLAVVDAVGVVLE